MKLAGIQNIESYEWNKDSIITHNENFNTEHVAVDIRNIDLSDLPQPSSIDIVVGSPPCTQFSFANRGGQGNIEDGLKDIHKFLSIVEYLKPKYWAMENVPRVKGIIDSLINSHPDFLEFKKLINFNQVVDCSLYGVPQRRKRMICGHFPFELFLSFQNKQSEITLGQIINSLKAKTPLDPIYGCPVTEVSDNDKEIPLSEEELRLNKEAKIYHPIYNKMPFPDPLDRTSRTVTSLCTRVSRESIIILEGDQHRRLSVRERASLMGFPCSFQFYGKSYSEKLKMIGNAIPPPLTYSLFLAMLQKDHTPLTDQQSYVHQQPAREFPITPPPTPKNKFSKNRAFRMCIPHLRFGSGVRFELSNKDGEWRVRFFYGNSKKISELELNSTLTKKVLKLTSKKTPELPNELLVNSETLQAGWIGQNDMHPFQTLDILGELAKNLITDFENVIFLEQDFLNLFEDAPNRSVHSDIPKTVAGILLGIAFNTRVQNENRSDLFSPQRNGVASLSSRTAMG